MCLTNGAIAAHNNDAICFTAVLKLRTFIANSQRSGQKCLNINMYVSSLTSFCMKTARGGTLRNGKRAKITFPVRYAVPTPYMNRISNSNSSSQSIELAIKIQNEYPSILNNLDNARWKQNDVEERNKSFQLCKVPTNNERSKYVFLYLLRKYSKRKSRYPKRKR